MVTEDKLKPPIKSNSSPASSTFNYKVSELSLSPIETRQTQINQMQFNSIMHNNKVTHSIIRWKKRTNCLIQSNWNCINLNIIPFHFYYCQLNPTKIIHLRYVKLICWRTLIKNLKKKLICFFIKIHLKCNS